MSAAEKVTGWPDLLAQRELWRGEGRTVVWTNGVFDLVHVGHVRSLEAAKSLGDVLVVGVNGDKSVRELKGPDRPLVTAGERAEVVAGLESVDRVVVFEETTPERALAELRPDIHAKGADYAPPDGKPLPERDLVESYGGRIEFLPFVPARSTSSLVEQLRG